MFAHDIQHLLVTLSLGPVYLCGHSLGGMVALALTLNAPASVHTLVLAETSYGTSSNRLEAFMTRWTRPMFSMFSVRWQAGLFARSLAKRNPRLQRYINREVLDYVQDSSTYLAIWDAVIAFDFASSLSKLQVPSLVIAGAQNKKTHAQARTFVQALPDAELIMIPEAGHLVNLDQPDAFNSALIAFFQTKVAPLERDGAIR
ncbi:hypothetical protein GCM10008019_46380 [Deinococcus soli (ex Cha et al. 2016)]|nr:hypothetical protein GCM10008019_46380 [Deinococcus soli (ex Cha et al. 2016)]